MKAPCQTCLTGLEQWDKIVEDAGWVSQQQQRQQIATVDMGVQKDKMTTPSPSKKPSRFPGNQGDVDLESRIPSMQGVLLQQLVDRGEICGADCNCGVRC